MILDLSSIDRVFLAQGSTDMRLSIDGLAAIVQNTFELDPFSSDLYVFCGKHRDRLKILHWDRNGFWLYYRRLDEGKIRWPDEGDEPLSIDGRQLKWLVEGLRYEDGRVYPNVHAKYII